MEYRGYTISEGDNSVRVSHVRDFELRHTFECGQCFRWMREANGSYTGVVKGRVINVSKEGDDLILKNTDIEDFKGIWYDYFDLETDYGKIKKVLESDDILKRAIAFGQGIRLLRQDFSEVLISFIISSNKSIPMIIKVVQAISQSFGNRIIFAGKEYFSFPEISDLADTTVKNLQVCGGGYRCKYIYHTSLMIINKQVNLTGLGNMSLENAKKELNKLPGVGPKIADCVLLYSGISHKVFPTDVWVKRVMEELYFHESVSLGEIQRFAMQNFGELSGYAQQYLFYYARENKIGTDGRTGKLFSKK